MSSGMWSKPGQTGHGNSACSPPAPSAPEPTALGPWQGYREGKATLKTSLATAAPTPALVLTQERQCHRNSNKASAGALCP